MLFVAHALFFSPVAYNKHILEQNNLFAHVTRKIKWTIRGFRRIFASIWQIQIIFYRHILRGRRHANTRNFKIKKFALHSFKSLLRKGFYSLPQHSQHMFRCSVEIHIFFCFPIDCSCFNFIYIRIYTNAAMYNWALERFAASITSYYFGATNRRAITDAPMHWNLTRTGRGRFVLPIHSLVELRSYEWTNERTNERSERKVGQGALRSYVNCGNVQISNPQLSQRQRPGGFALR